MARNDPMMHALQMVQLLSGNTFYTVKELSEHLQLNQRSTYELLGKLRDSDFFHVVKHSGHTYGIGHDSPFFNNIRQQIHLTYDEATALLYVVRASGADLNSTLLHHVMGKLSKMGHSEAVATTPMQQQMAHNQAQLFQAIELQQCAVLRGYQSLNSSTKRDRRVEPFAFLPGNEEVRCYEPEAGLCKTFKLSRIDEVEVLDLYWQYREYHERLFTDMFRYSGTVQMHVEMLLGMKAHQLLIEECPDAAVHMQQLSDSQWLLDANLCSYSAIGRFTLGTIDDVQVKGDEGFLRYLRQMATIIARKLA